MNTSSKRGFLKSSVTPLALALPVALGLSADAGTPARASFTATPQPMSAWAGEAFKSSPGPFLLNSDVRLLLDFAHRQLGFVGTGMKPPGYDFVASWQNRDNILVPGKGPAAALGFRVALEARQYNDKAVVRRQSTTWAYPLRPAPNGATAALIFNIDQTGFQSVTLAYLPPSQDPADGVEYRTWQGRVVKADASKAQKFFFENTLLTAAGVTAPTFLDATLAPLTSAGSAFGQQGTFLGGINGSLNLLHMNVAAYDAQHRDSSWWKGAISREPALGQLREGAKQLLSQGAKTAEAKLKDWAARAEKFFKKVLKVIDKLKSAIPVIIKVLGWLGFL